MTRHTFTEHQLTGLLEKLRVLSVFKDPRNGALCLAVQDGQGLAQITVPDFKARFVAALKDLEERRQEITENRFAAPVISEVTIAGSANVRMAFLKKDHQLTADETRTKRALLTAIDKEMRSQRRIIAALNYVQVHAGALLPALVALGASKELRHPPGEPGRGVWSKGVTSAALHCRNEFLRAGCSGRTAMDICREFLARYAIEGEPHYTPEQLHNNVLQIQTVARPD